MALVMVTLILTSDQGVNSPIHQLANLFFMVLFHKRGMKTLVKESLRDKIVIR